jgi:hypothetical protein
VHDVREKRTIVAGMTLRRRHVADATMAMLEVVPVHETGSTGTGCVQVLEAFGRKLRPLLRGAEQRLGVGNMRQITCRPRGVAVPDLQVPADESVKISMIFLFGHIDAVGP